MPPWPVRSSTTIGWPRWGLSQSPKMRAVVSFGPPAAEPTTQWTGGLGYWSAGRRRPSVIAVTAVRTAKNPSRRAARIITLLRVFARSRFDRRERDRFGRTRQGHPARLRHRGFGMYAHHA